MAYGDLEYLEYYHTHLGEIQKIEDRLQELPEADWIREMRALYYKHGYCKASDLLKLLGDPAEGVYIPTSGEECMQMLRKRFLKKS